MSCTINSQFQTLKIAMKVRIKRINKHYTIHTHTYIRTVHPLSFSSLETTDRINNKEVTVSYRGTRQSQ